MAEYGVSPVNSVAIDYFNKEAVMMMVMAQIAIACMEFSVNREGCIHLGEIIG